MMLENIHNVVLVLGDDISTDVIYPGRFMATVLPSETPQFAFADYTDFNAKLKTKKIPPGSVIIAGKNFGCGSSREQACSTLKGYDIIVVAKGFARIFLQNAVNLGLKTIVCPSLEASEKDSLEITSTHVRNTATGKSCPIVPLPKARQDITNAGGLIPYTRKRLLERTGKA
jgi:3-isopropylmalate/(R)-2-methylmalate dehydratase small subunit